jgi:hypothetical protein
MDGLGEGSIACREQVLVSGGRGVKSWGGRLGPVMYLSATEWVTKRRLPPRPQPPMKIYYSAQGPPAGKFITPTPKSGQSPRAKPTYGICKTAADCFWLCDRHKSRPDTGRTRIMWLHCICYLEA